jgi:hypothetical protein
MFSAHEAQIWIYTISADRDVLFRLGQYILDSPFIDESETFGLSCLNFDSSYIEQDLASDLISLLTQFPHKKCANPLNRVYSLPSLCPVEKFKIEVDYSIPLCRLAYQILYHQPELQCICSAMAILRALWKINPLQGYDFDDDQYVKLWIKLLYKQHASNIQVTTKNYTAFR